MPSVTVMSLPGTNCASETVRAFREAGARVSVVLLDDALSGRERIDGADVLCIAGGFSFGDHLGAGWVAGVCLGGPLRHQFEACLSRPVLGICNGFQILVAAGVFGGRVRLVRNAQGRFYNRPRQAHVVRTDNDSPWLVGLGGERLIFPCAHGEGRFAFDPTDSGEGEDWVRAIDYPDEDNPDGSAEGIAGITTPDGLVLGLMDHPERTPADAPCRAIFRNALAAMV